MLQNRHDYELLRDDIQLLSSRDAITAFFAKLGYDTNQRLLQNVSAMGIGNDTLKTNIRHIERIASQDGGFLKSTSLNCAQSPSPIRRALYGRCATVPATIYWY